MKVVVRCGECGEEMEQDEEFKDIYRCLKGHMSVEIDERHDRVEVSEVKS